MVLCIGAEKGGDRLYVLAPWEDLTASPAVKTLALVLGGTELEVLAEEGEWVKVRVVGWLPRGSVTRDSTEPLRASEDPMGVETVSKAFRRAATPETADKIAIRLRFRNRAGGVSGDSGEIRLSESQIEQPMIANVPGRSLAGFAGALVLRDKSGKMMASGDVVVKQRLDSGESAEWDWVILPGDKADEMARLGEEDLKGSELRFITKETIYTDGSTRTFGEEDDR